MSKSFLSFLLLVFCYRFSSAFEKDGSGSIIGVNGTQLMLYGKPYKFVGTNCYQIATLWGTNNGCGGEFSEAQLDLFFSSLPKHSLVRFWAFQGTLAINDITKKLDWGPIDRVFNACEAYGHRLIASLTNQWGTCDNNLFKEPSWYFGGYMDIFNNNTNTTDGMDLTPLSYWDYVNQIVPRYRDSPALGMWEPINEAEASTCPGLPTASACNGYQTCPNETYASLALRYFFDNIGALIHELDPYHLIESGLLGGGQCGSSGGDYSFVSASPGIDVLSYHDYYGSAAMGGDQWNGIAVRLQQARELDKPIIGGESGMLAGVNASEENQCYSYYDRGIYYKNKLDAQLGNGSSGLLVWDYSQTNTTGPCNYNTWLGDPVMTVIQTYPIDIYPSGTTSSTAQSSSSSTAQSSSSTILFSSYLLILFCVFYPYERLFC